LYPQLRGTLASWSSIPAAVICLAAAAFSHNRYLHSLRLGAEASVPRTFRRTCNVRLLGLPLYDIYIPATGDNISTLEAATARGIFALGMSAKGVVAVGVLARGGGHIRRSLLRGRQRRSVQHRPVAGRRCASYRAVCFWRSRDWLRFGRCHGVGIEGVVFRRMSV